MAPGRYVFVLRFFGVLTVSAAAAVGYSLSAGSGDVFTPNGTQPGLTYDLLGPTECRFCHGEYDFQHNIEPYDTWVGSMMANAARDPLFWAAVDIANNDVPGIGEYCLRCHAPSGWLAGRANAAPPDVGDADGCALEGYLDDPGALPPGDNNDDFVGVSCHLCHRMMINDSPPPGESPVYTENAQYWLDDADCDPTDPGSGPCRRGPYDYDAKGGTPPLHEWAYSPYHESSAICGNCHNVTNPILTLIDETGTDTGIPYPIERTYAEWVQSEYSDMGSGSFATCQNCHMPDSEEINVFACIDQKNVRTGDLPVHRFVGGNTWIPAVLRDRYPTLGLEDPLNATIAWATELLQNDSATVEISAPPEVGPGGVLDVSVTVTNLSGHKLPTGYVEGRRMWIQIEAQDALGIPFFTSGAYDDIAGELDQDPQVKIYETQRGIWNRNGNSTCDHVNGMGVEEFHFVLNDCILTDNRIPPLGFTGGSDPETQPVGYSYPETFPGSGVLVNYDVTDYAIPIPEDTLSPVTVHARLLYQIATKEYVEFLRDEAIDQGFGPDCAERNGVPVNVSRGQFAYDVWDGFGKSAPVQMATAAGQVVIEGEIFDDGFESGDTSAWDATIE